MAFVMVTRIEKISNGDHKDLLLEEVVINTDEIKYIIDETKGFQDSIHELVQYPHYRKSAYSTIKFKDESSITIVGGLVETVDLVKGITASNKKSTKTLLKG